MSAPPLLDVPSAIKSAESPKDFSRWHGKKKLLYDLFINQGKSLNQVKTIMETEHGFPETLKRSDYEYVLRDVFKYRKNLSADEWRFSIGPRIARRESEGKRSEVLLNGSKVENVDRRIRRSFQSKRSHRRTQLEAYNGTLPRGVVIRTPSPQPSAIVVSPVLGENLAANEVEEQNGNQPLMELHAEFPSESEWINLLTGVLPLSNAASSETVVLSAQLLREGCPINKLLTMLDEYERKFKRENPRLFGPDSTVSILGKLCYEFSNNLQDETISCHEMTSVLDWIGFSVDIPCFTAFFSQQALTVRAAWEALNATVRKRNHSAAFDTLFSVHLSVMEQAPWDTGKPNQIQTFRYFLKMAPNRMVHIITAHPCDQWKLDKALEVAVSRKFPIELVKQLVSAGASLRNQEQRPSVNSLISSIERRGCEAVDLALLQTLLEAGAVIDEKSLADRLVGWPSSTATMYATDYLFLRGEDSIHNNGLRSLVSLYTDRHKATISVSGIFDAAQGGQEQLHSYLNARLKPCDDQDRKRILERTLYESSGKRHANVVQSLVQFGVDPNVRLLLKFYPPQSVRGGSIRHTNIRHPVIRAANSGDVDTLWILINVPNIDIVLLDQVMGSQLDLCALRNMEICQRDQILRALSTLGFATAPRREILLRAITPHHCDSGHDGPDFGFVTDLLERGLACLDLRGHLDAATMRIFARAMERGCGIRELNYLLAQDANILSTLSADNIRALLEATLVRRGYGETSNVLEFLAQNCEGLRTYIQQNCSSLLSCLLKDMSCDLQCSHDLDRWENGCEKMVTVKWFLGLGASLKGPVLAALVLHANDSFVLATIDRVADMNTADFYDALTWAIHLGRLNIAGVLYERGAQFNDSQSWIGGHNILQLACEYAAPLWFLRFLVDRGAVANAPLGSNRTPTALQTACDKGAQLSCISFLIEKGADVNAPPAPECGLTALQFAARRGSMNLAGLLLDYGADVNALSGFLVYDTPFRFMRAIDLAAQHSRLDMVYFLAAAGARSCQPGRTGFEGAINVATFEGHYAVASLLLEWPESRSGDAVDAERRWLRSNTRLCMHKGRIGITSWIAFVKKTGRDSESDFREFLKEELVRDSEF